MKLSLSLFIFLLFFSWSIIAQDIAYSDNALYTTLNTESNSYTTSLEKEESTAEVLKERFETLQENTEVTISFNATIEYSINSYLKRQKNDLSNLIDKSKLYFPIFEEYLSEYSLPDAIKYLAVVESRLEPNARSYMGAKGLWQFMPNTGKEYGLTINFSIDERLDAIKATQAACKYLKELHRIFGDWNLALAAYNAGPGNVKKAIRRSGGHKDFWKIRPYLPKETRNYIPSFYTAFYMFEYAKEYNVYSKNIEISYDEVTIIEVKNDLTFSEIQHRFDIDAELLKQLNPQYKLGRITYSKSKKNYLILPNSVVRELVPCKSEVYELAKRAARKTFFYLGSVTSENESKCYGDKEVVSYTVKEGDSLWKIAKEFPDATINQIKSWNNLWSVNYLKPGTQLKILTN